MKILYISHSVIPSIAANSIHVCKMTQAIANLGHDVELLAIKPSIFNKVNNKEIITQYGLKKDIKLKTFPRFRGMKLKDYFFQVSRYCKKHKPDLVYTRSIQIANIICNTGVPVVYECHGDIHETEIEDFKLLIEKSHLMKVIVISKALYKILADKYDSKLKDKMYIAHDGVDLERFENNNKLPEFFREKLQLPQKYTVMYSGHLYQGRGIEIVFGLAKRFTDLSFVVVGGRDEDVNNCQKMASENEVSNILFTGFVNNGVLSEYLGAANVLLMPYQTKVSVAGNFGNSVSWMSPLKMFEYMATLRPIISSDLPALREVLDDNQSLFCQPDDIEQWANALHKLLDDIESSNLLAFNAFQNVKKYTWNVRAKNILAQVDL